MQVGMRSWRTRVAIVAAGWAVGLVHILLRAMAYWTVGQEVPWADVLWSWVGYGLVSFGLPWLVARAFADPLDRERWRRQIPAHLGRSALIAIGTAAGYGVLRWITVEFGGTPYSLTRLWQSFLNGWFLFDLFLCSAVSIGASAFEAARRLRDKELESARLESELATTRLRLLKAQLDPHFLFNTLNAISTLVRREPAIADRMIENLAEFLRRLLEVAGRDEVSLERVLEHLGLYVEIQKVRFRDRLFFEVDAAPETLQAAVPHMLLQPLVENSIQHGKAPRRALRVVVRAGRQPGGQTLELMVDDDGVGFEAAVESTGGGVGLANIRARLQTLYGPSDRLTLSARPGGGARVCLTLPWRLLADDVARPEHATGSSFAPREVYELARTDRR